MKPRPEGPGGSSVGEAGTRKPRRRLHGGRPVFGRHPGERQVARKRRLALRVVAEITAGVFHLDVGRARPSPRLKRSRQRPSPGRKDAGGPPMASSIGVDGVKRLTVTWSRGVFGAVESASRPKRLWLSALTWRRPPASSRLPTPAQRRVVRVVVGAVDAPRGAGHRQPFAVEHDVVVAVESGGFPRFPAVAGRADPGSLEAVRLLVRIDGANHVRVDRRLAEVDRAIGRQRKTEPAARGVAHQAQAAAVAIESRVAIAPPPPAWASSAEPP